MKVAEESVTVVNVPELSSGAKPPLPLSSRRCVTRGKRKRGIIKDNLQFDASQETSTFDIKNETSLGSTSRRPS